MAVRSPKLFTRFTKNFPEFMRFLLTGGFAAILDIAVFKLLITFFPTIVTTCYIISFGIAAVCRFFADKFYTFNNAGNTRKQFFTYIFSCLLTLGAGILIFNFLILLHLPALWSKVISIPLVTFIGYFLFKILVFKRNS